MLENDQNSSSNLNDEAKKKVFPLHKAAESADLKIMKKIIESEGNGDVDEKDEFGKTPLSYLINIIRENKNQLRPYWIKKVKDARLCVNILIQAGANINRYDLLLAAVQKYVKYHESCDFKHIEQYGKNVNWNGPKDEGNSLLFALAYKNIKVIKKLIILGADVRKGDFLYKVVERDEWEVLEYILNNVKYVDSNYKIEGKSLFSHACAKGRVKVASLLIESGAAIESYKQGWKIKEEDYNRIILIHTYSINSSLLGCDYIKPSFDFSKKSKLIIKNLLDKSFSALIDGQGLTQVYNEMLQNSILNEILEINSMEGNASIEFVGAMKSYAQRDDVEGFASSKGRTVIANNKINEIEKGTLAHELTHSMFFIMNNYRDARPYTNESNIIIYNATIVELLDNLALEYIKIPRENLHYTRSFFANTYEYGKFLASISKENISNIDPSVEKLAQSILEVYKFYSNDKEHIEMIVKYPEALASNYGSNETVEKILAPLKDYWQQYVTPRVKEYMEVSHVY